jgi:hypothetical protein
MERFWKPIKSGQIATSANREKRANATSANREKRANATSANRRKRASATDGGAKKRANAIGASERTGSRRFVEPTGGLETVIESH